MEDFIKNIRLRYKQWDLLLKLISVNVAVFLVFAILNLIVTLFKVSLLDIQSYFGLSSNVSQVLSRPWTLFTYMFVHEEFFHILFNMILLYSFGRIFTSYFSLKNLAALYILGGLSGGLFFILAFNTIPYYLDFHYPIMVGASASVTAIIFAASFYRPDVEVSILILRVKILYVALFIFALDCLELASVNNPGGSVAHIGGAIIGYIFAKQYLKGRDLTAWMNKSLDWVMNLFKPQPKMKIKHKRTETEYEYNERKNQQTNEIDKILDKLKESGYSSLSKDEKKCLFDASNKNKKNFHYVTTRIIWGTNVIALVLLLSNFCAWYIAPTILSIFAYIGMGFPFILFLNLCYLIFGLFI